MLHITLGNLPRIFVAPLRHRLHETLPSVTPYAMNTSRSGFAAASVENSRIWLYFAQHLLRQKCCETCSFQGVSHKPTSRGTCVATKLWDKMQEKLQCNRNYSLSCKSAAHADVYIFAQFGNCSKANVKPIPWPSSAMIRFCKLLTTFRDKQVKEKKKKNNAVSGTNAYIIMFCKAGWRSCILEHLIILSNRNQFIIEAKQIPFEISMPQSFIMFCKAGSVAHQNESPSAPCLIAISS